MSAQGVHARGINPLVSVNLYSKVIVPIALGVVEQPNKADISAISCFQHKAVKQLQGLPAPTRSDMAESMVGLNRLPSKIKARKLMFLHKIISLPAGSVSRQLFISSKTYSVSEQQNLCNFRICM